MKLPKLVIDLVYPLEEFEVYAQRAIAKLIELQELPLSDIDAFKENRRAVAGAVSSISVSQAVAMFVKTTKVKNANTQ